VSASQGAPGAVLEAYARLRAAPAVPGTGRDEAWLLKGSQPANTVTREVLNGWRANLYGPAAPERFRNPHYQALLGALALMVLDAGRGLEVLKIPPVGRLQAALQGPVKWDAVEAALDEFRYVPLWSGQGATGPSLAALQGQVAGLDPAVHATPCARAIVAEVARGGRPDVYWKRIEPRMRDLARCAAEVRPQSPVVVARVPLPAGCASRACRALDGWNRSGEAARWAEAREALRAAVSEAETRLGALVGDLPDAIDWGRARAAVGAAREAAARLDRPPDDSAARKLGDALGGLEDLAGRLPGLEAVAAYRKALRHLVAGDPRLARRQIESAGPDWRTRPELVAAYLAAEYWEGGGEAVQRVCRAERLACEADRVGREARRVERLLGLGEGVLGPRQIS
jgi:hypothetical protein